LSYLVRCPIEDAAPCCWRKLRLHGLGYFVSQCLVASRHLLLLPTSPFDKPICTDNVPRLEICSPCRGFELVEPLDQLYNMMCFHCVLPPMHIFEHPSPTQVRVLGVPSRPSVCSRVSLHRQEGWCSIRPFCLCTWRWRQKMRQWIPPFSDDPSSTCTMRLGSTSLGCCSSKGRVGQ
jgi:hypothetical protein